MNNAQKRDSFKILLARCLRYGVASVKIPVRLALIGGVSFGITAGVATFMAGTFITNLIQQANDVYVVYRLTGERDELSVTNQRLEQKMAALQREYVRKIEYQESVKAKLKDLHKVLEASSALSLLNGVSPNKTQQGDTGKQVAVNNKRGGSQPAVDAVESSLTALLNSPHLRSSRSAPVARKKEISLSVDKDSARAMLSPLMLSPLMLVVPRNSRSERSPIKSERLQDDEQALLRSLDFYLLAMEVLPIGSPVVGRLSSGFGYRTSPFSHQSSFHEGIDISLSRGGAVVATGAGVVKSVRYHSNYGWVIDVQHTQDIVTRYAHLTKAMVKVGQEVDRGQRIALSGSSGRSTGPHLHYEVLHNGRPKNPKPFIKLAEGLNGLL